MRSRLEFLPGPLMLLISALVLSAGSRGFLFIPGDSWLGPAVSLVLIGGAILRWRQFSNAKTPPRVKASSRFAMAMAGWGVVMALPLGGWWIYIQYSAAIFLLFVALKESMALQYAPDSNAALPISAPRPLNSISVWIGFALIVVACAIPFFPGDYDFGVAPKYAPVLHVLAVALGVIGVGLIFSYAFSKKWRIGSRPVQHDPSSIQ